MISDRSSEPELLRRWQFACPRILAGLLDGVCCALRNVDGVTLPNEPRLIGALKWATAAEPNFGFDDRDIFKAYQDSALETIQAAFEADVVAIVLTRFIRSLSTRQWEGTSTALFTAINGYAADSERKMKSWPPSPAALTNRIDRAAPVLRSQGVHVERRRSRTDRLITIVALDPA
jgi:hypothetical protein